MYKTNCLLCGWRFCQDVNKGQHNTTQHKSEVGQMEGQCTAVRRVGTKDWEALRVRRSNLFAQYPKALCPTVWRPLLPDMHVYHLVLDPFLSPVGHSHISATASHIWTTRAGPDQCEVGCDYQHVGVYVLCMHVCLGLYHYVCLHV